MSARVGYWRLSFAAAVGPLEQQSAVVIVARVRLGMMFGRFGAVMRGMRRVSVRGVGMVRGVLVIAVVMVLGGLVMMVRRLLMMLGCRAMMFSAFVFLHDVLPLQAKVDA